MTGKKKYSNERLASIVESEGLSYSIMHYISPDQVEDDEMREQWQKAYDALHAVDELLPELPDDYYE